LIIVIALHLAYEYFIVRKKWEDEDYYSYMGNSTLMWIGIWFYAEHLFVDTWEFVPSKRLFAFYFLFPYAFISRLIGGSWRHWKKTVRFFRRRDKTSIQIDD
jgi:hypothetical protein